MNFLNLGPAFSSINVCATDYNSISIVNKLADTKKMWHQTYWLVLQHHFHHTLNQRRSSEQKRDMGYQDLQQIQE